MADLDDIDATRLGITLLELRYALELQPKPRARNWTLIGVLADLGDGIYLADTYRDHEGRRARVVDTEDGSIVHDTKDKR